MLRQTIKRVGLVLAWPFLFLAVNVWFWVIAPFRFIFLPRFDSPIRKGQEFEVVTPFRATVLAHWHAPFTDGVEVLLPPSTRLRANEDALGKRVVQCVPASPATFEAQFVPIEMRSDPKYAGCSLTLSANDLAKCQMLH